MLPNHSSQKIVLDVRIGRSIPSFKNCKRAILDRSTGKMRTLTPGKIKKRMQLLEDGILSALCSMYPTLESGTVSECQRRRQTALSGLLDDSLKEIPEFSFGVEYVVKGNEGVTITIESLS